MPTPDGQETQLTTLTSSSTPWPRHMAERQASQEDPAKRTPSPRWGNSASHLFLLVLADKPASLAARQAGSQSCETITCRGEAATATTTATATSTAGDSDGSLPPPPQHPSPHRPPPPRSPPTPPRRYARPRHRHNPPKTLHCY